jgi:hypothetical protein
MLLQKKKDFELQNLVVQELPEAEKKELKEYGISNGYQPGAMLFGGIDEEALGCIHDRDGTKIIGTLSKSAGFPKLESDISATSGNISSAVPFTPILR